MHVLYHLHSLFVSDSEQSSSSAAVLYDKFLTGVVRTSKVTIFLLHEDLLIQEYLPM